MLCDTSKGQQLVALLLSTLHVLPEHGSDTLGGREKNTCIHSLASCGGHTCMLQRMLTEL